MNETKMLSGTTIALGVAKGTQRKSYNCAMRDREGECLYELMLIQYFAFIEIIAHFQKHMQH